MAKSIEHNIFPDLAPRAELYEKIGLIEKSWLDQAALMFPEHLNTLINGFSFFQLNGVQAIFEEKDERLKTIGISSNFISGLYNQSFPLCYVIICRNSRISIYLGTNNQGAYGLSALLEATVGETLYKASKISDSHFIEACQYSSALTGIPTPPDNTKNNFARRFNWDSGIDNLVSAMMNEDWAFMVQAFPINREQTNRWLESCTREVKDIKEAFLLRDIQKSNRTAVYYTEVLEKSIKRLVKGKQQKLWQTGVYFLANNQETVLRGSALLTSIYSGDKSSPEPVRSHLCRRSGGDSPFINCFHSKELCNFISLPTREFPGFRLHEEAVFDVDFESVPDASVLIGQVMANNRTCNHPCAISIDDLTKHGIVAGVTGSGKTNTVFNILLQLNQPHNIPFLVIEPAKSEYRDLLHEIDSLLVFTLGEERPGLSAPFRLNPFYFSQGISLQTHIDFLKAVFSASFVMYAPMPYILEECLYKIYEDKGWNLVTSANERGYSEAAFPTLTDLYWKIDDVVDRIGYQDRTTMDIKSALKTRINNLCIGGKGMMLNTSVSVPIREIMSRPVVFELKYLGNDEEKAFMMGLILMAVWEYYEAIKGVEKQRTDGLKHLLVIEEAHRLLKNVPTEKASEEQSNIRGQGIETFCNLLSEIRSYGEGVIVSEQIPVKLAPDVVKNSNLKIMHRLVAKEDRDFLGDTMSLDSHQKRQAVRLGVGEGVFFREGLDRSLKVRVPVSETKKQGTSFTDSDICQAMQTRFYHQHSDILIKFNACKRCKYKDATRCELIKRQVSGFTALDSWPEIGIKLFIPYLADPGRKGFKEYLRSIIDVDEELFYCFTAHLIQDYIKGKGDYFKWPFEKVERLVAKAQQSIDGDGFTSIIGHYCHEVLSCQGSRYSLCKTRCRQKGLYCYEGSILARDPGTHNRLINFLSSDHYGQEFYQQLVVLLKDFIGGFVPSGYDSTVQDLSICYLIQKLNEHNLTLSTQQNVLENFIEALN